MVAPHQVKWDGVDSVLARHKQTFQNKREVAAGWACGVTVTQHTINQLSPHNRITVSRRENTIAMMQIAD